MSAESERPAGRRRRRPRELAAIALLVVASFLLAVGDVMLYARGALFDSREFADRAVHTLDHEQVRAVLASRTTDGILAAEPDLTAGRALIESASGALVASPPFQSLLRAAVTDLHRTVFDREQDSVTLKLTDVGLLVIEALRTLAPDIAAKIPPRADSELVRLSSGTEGIFADAAQTADNVRADAILNLLWAALFFAGSIALATQRRRAVWRVGVAAAVVGALWVVAYYVGRGLFAARFDDDATHDAARAVWTAFLGDFATWNLVLAGSGVVLAASAASLIRPVDSGETLRRLWGRIAAVPQSPWRRGLRALALIAAGAVVIVVRESLVSLALLAAGMFLVYSGLVELLRMSLPPADERETVGEVGRRAAPRLKRTAIVGAVALALIGGFALIAAAADEPERPPQLVRTCNGERALCERALDEVAFAATHNSMSGATEPGWLFANHSDGMTDQLEAGYRALLIDTHYGFETPKGVATDLQAKGKSRDKLVDEFGEEFVATAERLRSRLGYRGGGEREVFLCHGFCELGATRFVDGLREIRDFVVQNPGEVVVLSIEDDVSPQDTAEAFEESGLLDFVYMGRLRAGEMPTLRELIDSNERVIVMAEDNAAGVPWYHHQFDVTMETPFRFGTVEELAPPASCAPNRGGTRKPLLLINNWVDTSPAPLPSNAARANDFETLFTRARACARLRRALPNLLAVDFYDQGDAVEVARVLNRLAGG